MAAGRRLDVGAGHLHPVRGRVLVGRECREAAVGEPSPERRRNPRAAADPSRCGISRRRASRSRRARSRGSCGAPRRRPAVRPPAAPRSCPAPPRRRRARSRRAAPASSASAATVRTASSSPRLVWTRCDVRELRPPFAAQLRLHVLDQVVVLGVHHRHRAEPRALLEQRPRRAVVEPDPGLRRRQVGGEELEGRRAVGDGVGDRGQRRVRRRAGEDRMKGEVGIRARRRRSRGGASTAAAASNSCCSTWTSMNANETTVVVPPWSAARVAPSGGWSQTSRPCDQPLCIGSWMCACGSTPPGNTSLPVASITRPASASTVPGGATKAIVSPGSRRRARPPRKA